MSKFQLQSELDRIDQSGTLNLNPNSEPAYLEGEPDLPNLPALSGIAPENQLDLDKGSYAVQQDDYSVVCQVHGLEIHLRDMNLGDLEAMQRYDEPNITSQMRLISRICTKWGDRPGITLEQLRKERPMYFMKVSRAVEHFFLDK